MRDKQPEAIQGLVTVNVHLHRHSPQFYNIEREVYMARREVADLQLAER